MVHPIAGTRPRGATAQRGPGAAEELIADPKELAEHLMLVDLGRNDVGRVAQPGSVRSPIMSIERYSHVMHIVSNVPGGSPRARRVRRAAATSRPARSPARPRSRAMQIIDDLVKIYGGRAVVNGI